MRNSNNNAVILIPTLNPNSRLVGYVDELLACGFKHIIVVDDGSDEYAREIFDEVKALGNTNKADIEILPHAINLGKGRGLKTGTNFYLAHIKDRYDESYGVISVDSDGQHAVEDVENLASKLNEVKGTKALLLGCRNFYLEGIPFKSRFGNRLTRTVFKLCFGKDIIDTQTGLRAFTNEVLPDLMELYGERFEYETNVLIECVKKNVDIIQLSIQTIYENNNSGTHFNPVQDSIKIYKLILKKFFKYIFASLSSFLIDCALFWLLCKILGSNDAKIWIATVGARIISSAYNYFINKTIVFEYKRKESKTLVQYYALCLFTMLVSGLSVNLLYGVFGKYEVVLKCVVDMILFVFNYYIQQIYIFRDKK